MKSWATKRFLDVPSGRHGNGDQIRRLPMGHSEIKKWVDSDVTKFDYGANNTPLYQPSLGKAGPRDYGWWTNHIAAFAQ